jgi:hypothetical protein
VKPASVVSWEWLALVLGHAALAEGHRGELTTEHRPVELHRLAGVALEVEVGVEDGHVDLLGRRVLVTLLRPTDGPNLIGRR